MNCCLCTAVKLRTFLPFQQSHRRQHNKDKPFKCQNCNRGYTDAASLEVHLSTHTVKHAKLFSCGLCNRSYTSVLRVFLSQAKVASSKERISNHVFCSLSLPAGDVSDETYEEAQPRPADGGGNSSCSAGSGSHARRQRPRTWPRTRSCWSRRGQSKPAPESDQP